MSVMNRPLGGLAAILGAELILDTWEEVALGVGIFLSRPYKIPFAKAKTFGMFYDEVYNVAGAVIRRAPPALLRASRRAVVGSTKVTWKYALRPALAIAGRNLGKFGLRIAPRVAGPVGVGMAVLDAAVLISDLASGDEDRIHSNFYVSLSDMAFAPAHSEWSFYSRLGLWD